MRLSIFALMYLLTSFVSAFAVAGSTPLTLLKDTRSQIYFPDFNDQERVKILEFSKYLFENTYVNLERKMKLYGVDPIARLKELDKTYSKLSVSEFHYKVLEIYNSVNDMHVNYYLPAPYGCYTSNLPISMQMLDDKKVYVSKVKLALKESFPEIERITPGDEVLKYDHELPLDVIAKRRSEVPASTEEGKVYQGILDLFWRAHESSFLPKKNYVTLKLQNKSGHKYVIKVPFFVSANQTCLDHHKNSLKSFSPFTLFKRLEKIKMKNDFWDEVKSTVGRNTEIEKADLENLGKTSHPDILWKVIDYHGKKMGYIKLKSFNEAELGDVEGAEVVKNLLLKELKETDGLLFDVRGNYGGQIPFAEKVSALFTNGKPPSVPFYIKANNIFLRVFTEMNLGESIEWETLLRADHESNLIIGPGPVTTEEELSSFHQVYFKKVALLTNSECFSSCDVFAGVMKDNNHVTIYGTGRSTFGGGANVWDSVIFEQLLKVKLIDYMGMRMTIRQSRRLSDNSLIEDVGVATDIYLPETVDDITNPTHSRIVAQIFKSMLE